MEIILNQRVINVVEYDPSWNVLFETEKSALANIIGNNAVKIEHIGSTAVKGLNAKPVIDILVNNAGTILRAPAAEHNDELFDTVMEVNLNAQFILSREIGKGMLSRQAGKIIFTASLLTYQGGITVPGYAASKGAIGQLVMALSNEWASQGINVNAIAPGYIATDNTEALRNDSERSTSILSRIPQGRWGKPEDFMGPVVFLASDASTYMNGSTVLVDGGWMGR